MQDDLRRMEYIPNQMYNFHPGSHTGQGVETGINQIADMLNKLLTKRTNYYSIIRNNGRKRLQKLEVSLKK